MKNILLVICFAAFMPVVMAQTKAPKKITAAEAKDHLNETVTVCGKAVDTRMSRYAIADRGKPVQVNLDQPEPSPVFYFVAFGADPKKPGDVATKYVGKEVCVTGAVNEGSGAPFIMVKEATQVKLVGDK
jgi:hypothetical protein